MGKDIPNADLIRIIIKGPNIQGVNLREKVKELADDNKISRGFIRNVREKGTVEIIIRKMEAEKDAFIKGLESLKVERDSMKIDSIEVKDTFFDEDDLGDEFTVRREDDLHEMFWALQGAGKVFEVMEKKRIKGQIRGLIYELNSLEERFLEVTEYEPSSIINFLTNCPVADDALIESLQIICQKCREINLIKNKMNPEYARVDIEKVCKVKFKFQDKELTLSELIDNINSKLMKHA